MVEARIDLNCDLGESFGHYRIGQDEMVLDFITSANIACGFHAGDYNVMYRTVKMAAEKGVALGAHPGLPDLLGFGRRTMQVDPDEVYHFTLYQVGALHAFAKVCGQRLQHVKPHGALYNMAAKDRKMARAVARAVYDFDRELILFGLAGSVLVEEGRDLGLRVAEEVFADRTYQPDGTLIPRNQHNALIHDHGEAIARVIRMVKEGKVTATDGTDLEIKADTVCIHGDEPHALHFAQRLREALQENGIQVQKVGER